ncbi:hypothetical protein PspLS_06791 [Pyricularia sp. CBS 133598]|nr:hypothetical protein PspLS_06791 [Pyricularia sp. CBS 133598]
MWIFTLEGIVAATSLAESERVNAASWDRSRWRQARYIAAWRSPRPLAVWACCGGTYPSIVL